MLAFDMMIERRTGGCFIAEVAPTQAAMVGCYDAHGAPWQPSRDDIKRKAPGALRKALERWIGAIWYREDVGFNSVDRPDGGFVATLTDTRGKWLATLTFLPRVGCDVRLL